MRLYSTLARDLVELPEPPVPIGMYVCGPTVYARAHIGNARPYVLASWYKRWLRERGYDVTLVHNITDVNDKIYEAAPGASAERARQATEWYLEDTGRFELDEVDHWPKVTESMDGIIAFIADLVERGYAYEIKGDVYFRVSRFEEYGRLSRQRLDQLEDEEETPNPLKEDPRDFALWKANKPAEDTAWDSPWGRGRPGWHIECSAMAEKLLGPSFEIHGGGLDLVFPHHENELAQSRALGHEFAKVWMHNGMLRFTGEKMSKSVGNVETIAEVLDRWGRETTLLYFLTAHWRSPIDFSDDRMADAQARAEGLREVFRNPSEPAAADAWEQFQAVLDDDFSTPAALALMHEWRDHELLRRALDVFGLAGLAEQGEAPPDVHALAAGRQEARAARDFARADELREQIEAAGWDVRDDPHGYRLVPRQ
jgi:cysteinyl-tRNA synthetase